MRCKQFIVIGGLMLTAQTAPANPALDTSNPLICAATQVVNCTAAGDCTRSTPDTFNLPVLFKVNIANKVVESARVGGEKRISAIAESTEVAGVTVLQRVDDADAWTTRIDVSSGEMTVAVTTEGHAFPVFGTCASL
ncbi:MAG: hypothetical protein PVF12_05395 [Thiohalocapsa sp.]|jgi:cytochrome c5